MLDSNMNSIISSILVLVLFISTTHADTQNGIQIQELGDLEGLRFEQIGEVKKIIGYHALPIHVDIETVITLFNNVTEYLGMLEEKFSSDTKRMEEVELIKGKLNLRKVELNDILQINEGLEANMSSTLRQKRSFAEAIFGNFLTKNDGHNIAIDLNATREKLHQIIHFQSNLTTYVKTVQTILNGSVEYMGDEVAIQKARALYQEIETKIYAIVKMILNERLVNEILSPVKFKNFVDDIQRNMTSNEELPFNMTAEYYHYLPINIKVANNSLLNITINIPIIERSPMKLYKIVELPARDGDNLIVIDAEWKFIALNDTHSTTMMSLDSCYTRSKTVFLCELKSPLKSREAKECVTNALVNRKIDMDLCPTTVAKFQSLTFIQLNDGQYFFFSPEKETLNIFCNAKMTSAILPKGVGILEIESGCKAFTKAYTLTKMFRHASDPYIKQNILSISFDLEEVKRNIKEHGTVLVDKFFIESMKTLREMRTHPKVEEMSPLLFQSAFYTGSVAIIVVSVLLIIMFVIYVCYTRKTSNQKQTN